MKNLIRVFAAGMTLVALTFSNVQAQDDAASAAPAADAAAPAETSWEGTVEAGEGDALTFKVGEQSFKLAGDKLADLKALAGKTVKITGTLEGDTVTATAFEEVAAAAPAPEGGEAKE
jgi:hypothetical protein